MIRFAVCDIAYSQVAIRSYTTKVKTDDYDPYAELVKERAPYLFCDVCLYYPIEPVHGHFMCPGCHSVTKCCEGAPMTLEVINERN
jgi:hypothetical protein